MAEGEGSLCKLPWTEKATIGYIIILCYKGPEDGRTFILEHSLGFHYNIMKGRWMEEHLSWNIH